MVMATIRDVAKLARVSVATVSRVLNESGYFDPETKVRVLEAVDQLGYQRNVHWSRLASNSSRTILFLLGNRESVNSMQMRLLVGSERSLQQQGYDLVFSRHNYNASDRAAHLKLPRLLEQPGAVDGVILAGLHYENLVGALQHRKLPYVMLGNNYVGSPQALKNDCVLYDDESGVYEATLYLLRLHHPRIAYVGNRGRPWFSRRETGYRRAIAEAGLEPLVINEEWNVSNLDYGQLAAAQLLREDRHPTAIFAANDEIAAGVWKELARRQISVPREISLIGFGDRAEFSILEPSLTSVSVFEEQLGERLAQLLLSRLKDGSRHVPTEKYPCKLMERHSCTQWRGPLTLPLPKSVNSSTSR